MEDEDFTPTTLSNVLGVPDDAAAEAEEEPAEQEAAQDEAEQVDAQTDEAEPEAEEAEDEKAEDDGKSDWARTREALANLKKENEALKAKEPQKRPDVFEDQDGAFQYVEEQVSKRVTAMSEEMVKAQYDDYDTVIERVAKEAQQNPAVRGEIAASGHPALKAYQIGKRLMTLDEIGDPAQFKEKTKAELREEVRKELEAEMKGEEKKKSAEKEALPDDLTSERNAGQRSGPAWSGPTSLDEVLS